MVIEYCESLIFSIKLYYSITNATNMTLRPKRSSFRFSTIRGLVQLFRQQSSVSDPSRAATSRSGEQTQTWMYARIRRRRTCIIGSMTIGANAYGSYGTAKHLTRFSYFSYKTDTSSKACQSSAKLNFSLNPLRLLCTVYKTVLKFTGICLLFSRPMLRRSQLYIQYHVVCVINYLFLFVKYSVTSLSFPLSM